jgi:hypothetical protein
MLYQMINLGDWRMAHNALILGVGLFILSSFGFLMQLPVEKLVGNRVEHLATWLISPFQGSFWGLSVEILAVIIGALSVWHRFRYPESPIINYLLFFAFLFTCLLVGTMSRIQHMTGPSLMRPLARFLERSYLGQTVQLVMDELFSLYMWLVFFILIFATVSQLYMPAAGHFIEFFLCPLFAVIWIYHDRRERRQSLRKVIMYGLVATYTVIGEFDQYMGALLSIHSATTLTTHPVRFYFGVGVILFLTLDRLVNAGLTYYRETHDRWLTGAAKRHSE